jgi:hypothetical protein
MIAPRPARSGGKAQHQGNIPNDGTDPRRNKASPALAAGINLAKLLICQLLRRNIRNVSGRRQRNYFPGQSYQNCFRAGAATASLEHRWAMSVQQYDS